jgi:formylglycine-generating enzyme required for sulfatase activity
MWEFAHLMTGVRARRQPDGRLELTPETGVVLVLLPGGTFWMGAQKSDPKGRNYDPSDSLSWVEGPVHQVRLSSPFFVSKYEMTQGQWLRLTGRDPAFWPRKKDGSSLLHPVEFISWSQAIDWMDRAGLGLPSEAQWEFAARGGTSTPWYTGDLPSSLLEPRAENLYDETSAQQGVGISIWREPLPSDGYPATAPVGRFSANAFGLHDVLGNVAEYCIDGFNGYFYRNSPWLDPMQPWLYGSSSIEIRVARGGSWNSLPEHTARASFRHDVSLDGAFSTHGVRPARPLDP